MKKTNPDVRGRSKDMSDRAMASSAQRGKIHALAAAGRKTTARTQGGARKGGGRDHDY